MGIDNTYGTLGLRPGVCTSTSRPASPYEGMVIYETDTNRVLVYDNSAWVMIADTDQPPGLQLVKTHAVGTGASSAVVSDVFSSEFDNYRIIISNVDFSAGSQDVKMTLGSTATGYYGTQEYNFPSTSTTGKIYLSNAAYFGVAFSGTNNDTSVSIELHSPYLSAYTTCTCHWQGNQYSGYFLGSLDNTTSYTAFTITPNSGTMTGGTIRVYGYRNS